MKRRGFLRSILGGVAAACAAPFVKAKPPCKHLAMYNGGYSTGFRTVCADCGVDLGGRMVGQSEVVFVGGQRASKSMAPCPYCGVLRYSAGAFCTCPGKLAERERRYQSVGPDMVWID